VDAFPNDAVYGLHDPGYSGSSGSSSERGIVTAALALYDHVRAEHPDIVIIGRSLGTGVARLVASQRPTTRFVLVTPFDGLADAAADEDEVVPRSSSDRLRTHFTGTHVAYFLIPNVGHSTVQENPPTGASSARVKFDTAGILREIRR